MSNILRPGATESLWVGHRLLGRLSRAYPSGTARPTRHVVLRPTFR